MYPKNQFPNRRLGIDNIMGIHIYIYQNGNKKICDTQMGVGNRLRLSIPWTAGAMILKYNDLYIYIYTSIKNGNKKIYGTQTAGANICRCSVYLRRVAAYAANAA